MRSIIRTGLKAAAAAAPAPSLTAGFGAAFRAQTPAELDLTYRNIAPMFATAGARHLSTDVAAEAPGDSDKPKLTPQEEAKRDHVAQLLYMTFVQIGNLNDGMHRSGARQEVVLDYYRDYLKFEKSLLGDETKESFSTLDDGTKIFTDATEHGLAMVARRGHKVIGRMFIGNELTSEKHLSILSSLSADELKAVGVEKSPEVIASEMLLAYRSHLEKSAQADVVGGQIKISCIGDYRHLVYVITDGQPGVCRDDKSLKRQIPMRSLLDGASEVLAGKVLKPMPVVERDEDLGLSDRAVNLYGRRPDEIESPWR